MKTRRFYKSLLSIFIIGELITFNVYPALAVHIPSTREILSDLNINMEEAQSAGQGFNSGANKSQPPQVSINFDPANPKEGEKLNATAYPMYFNNDPKNLYYTWYLKHANTAATDFWCDAAHTIVSDGAGNCDWSGDGLVNVEDWKIEAARIMTNNGFDWEHTSYFNYINNSGYEAKPGGDDRPTNAELDDTEDAEGNSVWPHCYIHDFTKGIDYELVKEVPDQGVLCPDGKIPVCAGTSTDATDGNVFADTCKAQPEEPTCSIQDSSTAIFSCPDGDEKPLCVDEDNISAAHEIFTDLAIPKPTAAPTVAAATTGGSMSAGNYYYKVTAVGDFGETTPSPESLVATVASGTTGQVTLDWADVAGASSYKVYRTTTLGVYATSTLISTGACGSPAPTDSTCIDTVAATTTGTPPTTELVVSVSDSCDNVDNNTDVTLGSGATALTYTSPWKTDPVDDISCSTDMVNEDVDFICSDKNKQHLFASPTIQSRRNSGDGTFTSAEEAFWRTDPQSASTAQNGNKDEANVVGLGQTTFSWNYQPGDTVGVAVEGVSATPTKYSDSSLMIMWALPKNKCEIKSSATGFYTQEIKGYNVKIPITSITSATNGQDACLGGNCLNDCLKDNLVDPQGDQTNLNVSLNYYPENPLNDPTDNNTGDEVSVSANAANAQDADFVKYQWEVYASSSMNPLVGWGNPLLKTDIPGATQTAGIGLSTFKFKMNFPLTFTSLYKYLKVRVVASEKNNTGSSDILIPINSTAAKIHVFSTDATDNLSLSLLKSSPTDQGRCDEGMDNVICPTVKNEIIGLQVDPAGETLRNILWTVDGQPLKPIGENCASGDCVSGSGEATDIAYLPILKENDEQYSVNLTADTASGKKINLTKTFKVNEPTLSITSASDSCQADYLGSYIDLDGQQWSDYSEDLFNGVAGSTIFLKPKMNMPFLQNIEWLIDGREAIPLGAVVDTATNTLSFTANKQPGESYTITVSGIYAQNKNIKKILNKYFDVPLNGFYETRLGASIELRMFESLQDAASAQAPSGKKILASLVTDIPAYISFLFRIALTTLLILFTSSILLSLSPKTHED